MRKDRSPYLDSYAVRVSGIYNESKDISHDFDFASETDRSGEDTCTHEEEKNIPPFATNPMLDAVENIRHE